MSCKKSRRFQASFMNSGRRFTLYAKMACTPLSPTARAHSQTDEGTSRMSFTVKYRMKIRTATSTPARK